MLLLHVELHLVYKDDTAKDAWEEWRSVRVFKVFSEYPTIYIFQKLYESVLCINFHSDEKINCLSLCKIPTIQHMERRSLEALHRQRNLRGKHASPCTNMLNRSLTLVINSAKP